jgi:hypothetical protein
VTVTRLDSGSRALLLLHSFTSIRGDRNTPAMAAQQAYQAYGHTNKGTLVPGQSIAVNKYTVQVERYLSQGADL